MRGSEDRITISFISSWMRWSRSRRPTSRSMTVATGSEQYPPTMMLALLIYCYATGRFGSRTIEAATYSDVAVRYLCANLHPDHSSICEFRVVNGSAFSAAFVSVLQLAQQLR